MTPVAAVICAAAPLASRLAPALLAAGFSLTRLEPDEARPETVRAFSPRLLILETGGSLTPEALQAYWTGRPMDHHLPILLLDPPGPPAFSLEDLDEPVDRTESGADPGEVAARARGLLREWIVRIFRRHFHDMSQPLTILRAYSQRAVKLVSPGDAVAPTLAELDRQVDRLFRIAEDLQKRRME